MNSRKIPTSIIGAGGHSRVVISLLRSLPKWDPQIIIDINFSGQEETIMGIPVVGGLDDLKAYTEIKTCLIAIGNNSERRAIFERLLADGYSIPSVVSPTAFVDETAQLGVGVFVGPLSFLGPMATVDDNSILNTGSVVEHESKVGKHSHIAPNATIAGRCIIGDEVLVGLNATLLPNVSVVSKSTVGAMSLMTKSTTTEGTFIGVPARPIIIESK